MPGEPGPGHPCRAPEYIRNDEDAKRIVRYFFEKNAPVAALCHGPMLLAAVT